MSTGLPFVLSPTGKWYLWYLAGFTFAILGGALWPPSRPIYRRLKRPMEQISGRVNPRHDGLAGAVIGLVERPLYVAAFLSGHAEFIALWLTLKVAGGWKTWTDELVIEFNDSVIPGRTLFNVMLIGSAVSLTYGATGALIITLAMRHDYVGAFAVPASLVAAHGLLYMWLRRRAGELRR